ncbi:alpha/beta hydrolase fold protein [Sphaerospermopsis reniformis]|uniref:Alpha/beta hydrolase fold protein n=1 Tax=Sphaerospermopsis reniformis TaxID=531300 RepID=A0A479ZQX9_9CYAN|nr:alpha/beta hydrolase fold protein [Sphaerospermopsis reniformis]
MFDVENLHFILINLNLFYPEILKILIFISTTLYQIIACWLEDRTPPPGQRVDVGGYYLHYVTAGEGSPTIVVDHSLGGVEGYLLLEELAKISRVCIYDRAGFGWSDISPYPRTSKQIVAELEQMLTCAGLEPPYILVGNSFGSYNMRLYAHLFPEKVMGMVLTDGLHESGMLQMSFALKGLQLFFISGFLMSIFGSSFGLIRVMNKIGVFELIKPELRNCSGSSLQLVKRSFCRPKHWLTMTQEIMGLAASGRQLRCANDFKNLPIVSIKAQSFFKPSLMTAFLPLKAANKLRERIHLELLNLSTNCIQINAENSGHFVWIDQPEVIISAVKLLLK